MAKVIHHSKYTELPQVVAFQIVSGFTVHLKFADGVEKSIDLEPYLDAPIFEPIRNNPKIFADMFIDSDTIAWRNGADIDPDTLYFDGPPPWAVQTPASTTRRKRTLRATNSKRRSISRGKTKSQRRPKQAAH